MLSKLSKFLIYGLRHNPEKLGCLMNQQGWIRISDLLINSSISAESLLKIRKDYPSYFTFLFDRNIVRANEKHSIAVDTGGKNPPLPKYVSFSWHSPFTVNEVLNTNTLVFSEKTEPFSLFTYCVPKNKGLISEEMIIENPASKALIIDVSAQINDGIPIFYLHTAFNTNLWMFTHINTKNIV